MKPKETTPPSPPPTYPAGHFTALIREHNWPPGWSSRIRTNKDKKTS